MPGYAANAFYPQLCQKSPILLLPVPLDRFIVGIKIEEECNCWVDVLTLKLNDASASAAECAHFCFCFFPLIEFIQIENFQPAACMGCDINPV